MNCTDPNLMDSITFWIALAGFVMSSASWIKDIITHRPNIEVRITGLIPVEDCLNIYLILANRSSLDITITDVVLHYETKELHCIPLSMATIGDREHPKREYSTQVPYHVSGLGGQMVLCCFEGLPKEIPHDATHLTLQMYTNRGRLKKKTLELPSDWYHDRYNILTR